MGQISLLGCHFFFLYIFFPVFKCLRKNKLTLLLTYCILQRGNLITSLFIALTYKQEKRSCMWIYSMVKSHLTYCIYTLSLQAMVATSTLVDGTTCTYDPCTYQIIIVVLQTWCWYLNVRRQRKMFINSNMYTVWCLFINSTPHSSKIIQSCNNKTKVYPELQIEWGLGEVGPMS